MEKKTGGGCNWQALDDLLFKGSKLTKMVLLAAGPAFLMMIIKKNETLPYPGYYSAINFLFGIAVFLSLVAYFFLHIPNFPYGPKVAAIIGLICLAFMTVTIPIISTNFLTETVYVVPIWVCYGFLVLVVCVCHLLPFPFPDFLSFWKHRRRSGIPQKHLTTDLESQEEIATGVGYNETRDHPISTLPVVASDTEDKAMGCTFEALNDMLFEGSELANMGCQTIATVAFLTMAMIRENETLPGNFSAITFCLGVAFLLLLASQFLHKSNYSYGPNVAVIVGLIGLAFMTVTFPIASNNNLPTVYAVLMWVCYVLLVLVFCVCYLLPFSFLDLLRPRKHRRSEIPKKHQTTDPESPEETEMSSQSSSSSQSSEFLSEVAENGNLDAVSIATNETRDHPINNLPMAASDTTDKATGGGCKFDAELTKMVCLVAGAVFLPMTMISKKETLPGYYSAITLSFGIVFLLLLVSLFLDKSKYSYGPKVAAIIGLIGSALMAIIIPIATTILLSTVYAVFMWLCFVLLMLLVVGGFLSPCSVPDLLCFWKHRRSGASEIPDSTTTTRLASDGPENGNQDVVSKPSITTVTSDASQANVVWNQMSPTSCSNRVIRLCPKDVEIRVWKFAVVCFVLGANPPLRVMQGFLRRVWGKHNKIANISMLPNGIFVVEFFKYPHALKAAAEGSGLMFDGKPVISKLWKPNLVLKKEEMIPATVPIWIQLPGLDFKYWKPSCLNKLAGLVGKPLKIDFLRILVEVNLNHQLPDWVYFVDEAGFWRKQKVDYVWKPVFCESCENFGHSVADCRKRSLAAKKMWVVKTSCPVVVAPNTDGSQQELVGEVHCGESVIKTVDKGKAVCVGC